MTEVLHKRFRMELRLDRLPPRPPLPEDAAWVAWTPGLMLEHARVKFHAFAGELDAQVFPSLGTLAGCRRLMNDLATRSTFLPGATWLLRWRGRHVACVQGGVEAWRTGMIHNLGVLPEARGRGFGLALLLQALHGFRGADLATGRLEVTAENVLAQRLYRRVGFRRIRTLTVLTRLPRPEPVR